MKYIATFIFVFSSVSLASAQQTGSVTLSGVVVDSAGNAIPKASIRLFSAQDTLFTSSTEEGRFIFRQLKARDFRLRIHHLSFVSREFQITVPGDSTSLDIGRLTLAPEVIELEELSVEKRPNVLFDGDTIHFETRHITDSLEEGTFLEELIDRLPGMRVDQLGRLTYMGEPVERARINGIDFFGGNIVLALRNLPAKLINRLQLIDDYGEMAALTGIRSGLPQKVLNLLVDDDQNRGIFTHGQGSYGIQNRYLAGMGFNYFNKHRQLAIGAGQNNRNIPPVQRRQGLRRSGQDGENRLSALDVIYSDKWDDRVEASLEYLLQQDQNNLVSLMVQQQQFGDDHFIHTQQAQTRHADQISRHIASGNKGFRIISKSGRTYLSFSPQARVTQATTLTSDSAVQQLIEQQRLQSEQTTVSTFSQSDRTWDRGGAVSVDSRLNKGSLRIIGSYNRSDVESDESRISELSIRPIGSIVSEEYLYLLTQRQRRREHIDMTSFFRKQVGTTHYLTLNLSYYQHNHDDSRTVRDGKLDRMRIDSLSNETAFHFGQILANAEIQKMGGYGWNYSIKLGWAQYNQSGRYGAGAGRNHRNRGYFVPNLSLEYGTAKLQTSLRYNRSVQQPSLDQLNPIMDRTDPWITIIGNPDLTAGLSHNIGASMRTTGQTKTLRLNLSGQYIQHKISADTRLIQDSTGGLLQELQYRNVSGDYQVAGDYDYSRSIGLPGKISSKLYVKGGAAIHRYRFIENGLIRQSMKSTFRQGVEMTFFKKQFSSEISVNYRFTQANHNQILDIRPFHEWSFLGRFTIPLYHRLMVIADINHLIQNGYTGPVNTTSPTIISCRLSNSFLKKQLEVNLGVSDLLDQQNTLFRRITDNTISDVSHNNVGRQMYVSVSWRIGKFGRNMPMGMVF